MECFGSLQLRTELTTLHFLPNTLFQPKHISSVLQLWIYQQNTAPMSSSWNWCCSSLHPPKLSLQTLSKPKSESVLLCKLGTWASFWILTHLIYLAYLLILSSLNLEWISWHHREENSHAGECIDVCLVFLPNIVEEIDSNYHPGQ